MLLLVNQFASSCRTARFASANVYFSPSFVLTLSAWLREMMQGSIFKQNDEAVLDYILPELCFEQPNPR